MADRVRRERLQREAEERLAVARAQDEQVALFGGGGGPFSSCSWQDRKERLARQKEREKALSDVQRGSIEAGDMAKKVENNLAKRRKRDEEEKKNQAEKKVATTTQASESKGGLPRPIGAVGLMATEQRSIGNSYVGVLSVDALAELYRRTAGCSSGPVAVLARARLEAGIAEK